MTVLSSLYQRIERNKIVIGIACVFWVILSLATISKSYFYYIREGVPPEVVSIAANGLIIWGVAALFAPVFIFLVKRIPLEFGRFYNIASHIFLSILFIPVHAFCYRAGILLWHGKAVNNESLIKALPEIMLGMGILSVIWYWLIITVYYLRTYYDRYKQRQLRNIELEAQLASIRLHVLKVQLHPHFLFNTLHNINTLIHENPDTAERLLELLSRFLEMSIHRVDDHIIRLNEEITFTHTYLEIEQVRFGNHLSVHTDIDPLTLGAKVPSLILQPLVENAVRHGISKKMNPGQIHIVSKKAGNRLQLVVEDDGPGLQNGYAATGIGLTNIKERLVQLYEEYTFELSPSSLGGLKVFIQVPFINN